MKELKYYLVPRIRIALIVSPLITCLHSHVFSFMPDPSTRQYGKRQQNHREGKPLCKMRERKGEQMQITGSPPASLIGIDKNVEIARIDKRKHLDLSLNLSGEFITHFY